jgi:hypothetical protein
MKPYNPDWVPRPGEITFKAWVTMEAKRTGLAPGTIYNYLSEGKWPYPTVRKLNQRVMFVLIESDYEI